jgi:hypothetical protein
VKGRGLAIGWAATAVIVLLVLGWAAMQTFSLARSGASAERERAALAGQLETTRQKMQAELRAKGELLKDIRWSLERPTGADVLRRLAALARDGHATVSAVAPVDKVAAAARSRESSHRIDMSASFHDIVDFATKVEREGALLEDVVIERATGALQAQFRLTTIEPSDDARQIMRRVLAANASNAPSVVPTALTLPIAVQDPPAALRDPFTFAEVPQSPARVPRAPLAAAPAPIILPAPTPIVLKGIVQFPRGLVAIVNDQIVKVGDVVDDRRVEEITERTIVLREPTGGSRSIALPDFASAPVPRARK